jgi:mono/diheme cytochrome c family protein
VKKGVLIIIGVIIGLFVIYEALITFDNRFKYGRMWETPAIRPHEEAPLDMQAGTVPVEGGEARFKVATARRLKSPFDMKDEGIIQAGHEFYFTFCVPCHGNDYDGNGTVGQSFVPLPTDLKNLIVQKMRDGELFQHISYGVPEGRQPPLATTISAEDRWRIIAYIKSLGVRDTVKQ